MIRKQQKADIALAGVSALIVFIALVLVAAIAASVILNTAGFLQERAQTTGQSSSDQISTTLNTISIVGEVEGLGTTGNPQIYSSGGTDEYRITEIRVTVLSAPGSPEIDLEDSTVQVTQSRGDAILVNGAQTTSNGDTIFEADSQPGAGNQAEYGLETITASTFPLIEDPEDRYRYIIPFDSNVDTGGVTSFSNVQYQGLAALGEGEIVELRFVTGPGGSTLERIRTPSTIPGNDGEVIVL